ncbi:EAL domain-containing protein [Massilia sp. CCM 9210]|uniref:EAL domain-containing protein n=1 Tax=Massilia scottii TaxID=3057166 RepID=UPI002796D00C|nr:EAL domain-containing protein [Massilia sp. CCM 9210]MDQ1813444.1 EAL domain-containing protein [Massilia sp. CCM 9210]
MELDTAHPLRSSPAAAAVLSACTNGVLLVDASVAAFPILDVNPAFCQLSGRTPEQLIGTSASLLGGAEGAGPGGPFGAALADVAGGGASASLLLRVGGAGGSAPWCRWTISAVPGDGEGGAPRQLVCIAENVSELHEQQALLAHLSTHDALTGLANRSLFNERLQAAMARARQRANGVAVLCLALDGFNLINESLGYVAGDQLLISVAMRIQGCMRPQDTLSRHGGNEFVLVLDEIDSTAQVQAVCEHIVRVIGAPFPVIGQSLHAGCSIGIARFPQDADDGVTLLRYADMALSHALGLGGNQLQFFTAEMNQRTAERAQMEAALRIALIEGQLQLQYQPVADLQQGAICALEALVRWQHPVMGLIPAGRFIPLAEAAGLTIALGYWSLRRAVEDMVAWRTAGLPLVRVAINISPKQFRDAALPQVVADALASSSIAPRQLSLEITEAALMQDLHTSDATLAQLKALGIGLTLDDFGTGYSSLNHLKRFPLDLVKIDCGLTGNIVTGADDAALVKTIISMAHHLGIEVAAEGVETEAQCDFLRRNMCDQIQGYFLAKPCDREEVAGMLAARHAIPPHLLRIQKQPRTLLLVDDEQNIVSALKRLLRRDGYQILSANSGQEGLDVLAANAVDVIVSDQRMPGMIGADFLRAAKGLYPDTIRIMLSGYTELQSVTDAVNEGAIFKFLTKPWDDEQLRGHIAEAFRLKEIADDNERLNLELRTANHELAAANRRMEDVLRQKQQQITRDEISLNVARELLQFVPLAVIGLDDDGMVAFVNDAAERMFRQNGAILGNEAEIVLPELFPDGLAPSGSHQVHINERCYQVVAHPMGANSQSRGSLITISVCEETE